MRKTFFVISFLLMSSLAYACDIPRYITVQGRLSDFNDVPVPSVSYIMNFSFYNSPTGGTLLWSEIQNVYVNSGIYNVEIGRNTTGGIPLPFDQPYFLETLVNGNTLSPRVNLTSSGYAFMALNLDVINDLNMNGYDISNSRYVNASRFYNVASPSYYCDPYSTSIFGGLNVTGPTYLAGTYLSSNLDMKVHNILNVNQINGILVSSFLTTSSIYVAGLSGSGGVSVSGSGGSGSTPIASLTYPTKSCGAGTAIQSIDLSSGAVAGCVAVGGGGGSSGWAINGNNIYNATTTGVGIGINSPKTRLDVEGGDLSGTALVGQTFSNLKRNAGFESGSIDGWPTGWSSGSINSTYAHTGTYSFRDFSGTSNCNEYLSEDIDTKTNTNYSVSGWIKTIGETANSGIFISEAIGTGCTEWSRIVTSTVTGTVDWTQKTIEAWNSSTCTKIRVGFTKQYCLSSGDTYFDDLMLTKGYSPKNFDTKPIVDSYSGNQSIMGGNFGIGTSGPLEKLDIAANPSIFLEGNTNPWGFKINVNDYGSGNVPLRFIQRNSGTDTEVMRIAQGGNVGIGTSNPANKLHVEAASNQIELTGNLHGASNQYALLSFSDGGDNSLNILTGYSGGSNNNITFSPGGTERVRFQQNGNVGIGTTSPTQALEVNGGVRLNTTTAKPTCDSTKRGALWFTQSASGVKDILEVCAKDASNTYAWRTLY